MTIDVVVQNVSSLSAVPSAVQFEQWAAAALSGQGETELTIRLVDSEESQQLNERFRQQCKPTNVLSFPADLPQAINLPLLGDIVICAPLVESEAKEQNKSPTAHWAHLTIHGILHLMGYDHQTDEEAAEMEALEIGIVRSLGFPDPYQS